MLTSSHKRLSHHARILSEAERREKRRDVSRRDLLRTAVGIGSVALLAACTGSSLPGSAAEPQPAKGPVTVTAMLTVTGAKLNAFPAQIGDPFKKLHPNVTLEGVPQSGGGTQQAMEQLTALIAGGTPPAIFEGPRFADFLVQKGFTDPTLLDGFIKRDHYKTDNYNPKELASRAVYQDHIVQLPWKVGGNALVILCNTDLFHAAGVALPPADITKPWSWDDWAGAAAKLTKRSGDTVTQFGHNGLAWTIGSWPLLWQTDWITPDLKTIICDNADMVDCYTRLQDLYYKSRVVPLPGQAASLFGNADLFKTSKAAMQAVSAGGWSNYVNDTPSVPMYAAPMPKVKITTADANTGDMFIVKGTKAPVEAWQAIQYLIEDNRLPQLVQQVPARLDYLEPYLQGTTKASPGIDTKLLVDVARNFVPQTLLGRATNQDQMYNLINPKLDELWKNSVTPSSMLAGLKAPLQALANS
jgi:ABC-type glycerol-3-phosphate transport system substrate-binding protein